MRDPCRGKFRAELMKAGRSKSFRRQPSRGAESAFREFRVFWTNSFAGIQMREALDGTGVAMHQS
jgi:hypothetical protein